MSGIRFLQRSEINEKRWDECISSAIYSSVYGYSWYLDALADSQWAGLVYDDYKAVFPLPWRKKFCIQYIYQPFFCQQLGLFGPKDLALNQSDFLNAIPGKFKKIHLQLNNTFPLQHVGISKPNYTLNLAKPYLELRNNFKDDALKNLKKSEKKAIIFKENLEPEEVFTLYNPAWGALNKGIHDADYLKFLKACKEAQKRGMYIGLGSYLNDELLGAAIFLQSPQAIHYLVSGPTENGRKISIMHGIVNYIIQKYAGQNLVLDFEGSKIADVAAFYAKWGSQPEEYTEVLFRRI